MFQSVSGRHLDPPVPDLAAGQVLSFSQTVEGSNCPDERPVTCTWLNYRQLGTAAGELLITLPALP